MPKIKAKALRPPRSTKTWTLTLPGKPVERSVVELRYVQVRFDDRYFIVRFNGTEIARMERHVFDRAKFLFKDMLGYEFISAFETKMAVYDKYLDSRIE